MSKDRFHLFGGGVLALGPKAATPGGAGDASRVGGWLLGKLGGELQKKRKSLFLSHSFLCCVNQRQTGISVSYRKHRYQGLWYQYRSRLRHFLGLGISIGIGRDPCTSFWVICKNSLLSKVSVSVSVPGHFPGISVSIGLDSD